MTVSPVALEPLVSSFADDPDLGEIVGMFVEEMPARVDNLLARLQAGDWEGLERAAHQLKGAAGSYGFDQITPCAARAERAVKQRQPEGEIRAAVTELVQLCQRVR